MIKRIAMRMTSRKGVRALTSTAGIVVAISVISASIIASGLGGSAAADDNAGTKVVELTPVSLAGRWTGHYYDGRPTDAHSCSDEGCGLTYDIVACKEGWCGIVVKDDKSCGAVGVHLASDAKQGDSAFKGKLELAKGAAPYAVEAWFGADKDSKTPELHFLGDTGPELMMFRRSYPFEANLARAGDATCTLDKATS